MINGNSKHMIAFSCLFCFFFFQAKEVIRDRLCSVGFEIVIKGRIIIFYCPIFLGFNLSNESNESVTRHGE